MSNIYAFLLTHSAKQSERNKLIRQNCITQLQLTYCLTAPATPAGALITHLKRGRLGHG